MVSEIRNFKHCHMNFTKHLKDEYRNKATIVEINDY